MIQVVSVKFRENEKAYYFDPNGTEPKQGEKLVVETVKGLELGECSQECHEVSDEDVVQPLRPVIRIATETDLRVEESNRAFEAEAFEVCQQKIIEHGLDMKLVRVERGFDGNKILFFFTSDGRVDFRDLVKDLAAVFRTRIELRQIGVRDEAKLLGGLGICGRPFCCSQFLTDFQPVSTKMAKVQSMSLNPSKISGNCGRLMCCLRYEYDAYEDMIKHSPKTGAFVETDAGYGSITQVNLLRHQVKVKLDGSGEQYIKTFDNEDVAVIPGGRPPEGEDLPHLLKPRPKPVQEEPPENPWERPELFAEDQSEPHAQEERKRSGQPRRRRKQRQGGQQGTANEGDGQRQPRQDQGQRQGGQPRPAAKRQGQQQKPQPRSERRTVEEDKPSSAQNGQRPASRPRKKRYNNTKKPKQQENE